MSLKCPSSPVYHTSAQQKLKSKNAAKTYRYGTPKIRDLLREKCRIRVREARQCSYEKTRNPANSINEILRQELAQLETDINLQEEIYKELVGEFNEWFAEQQEQEESYLIDMGASEELLCPVCQKNSLELGQRNGEKLLYTCECNANFVFAGDKELLRYSLRTKIDQHEQQCLECLSFFVEPQVAVRSGANILNAICEKCDYFCTL